MSLDAALLHALTKEAPEKAWAAIIEAAWAQCSQPLAKDRAPAEVTKRDRQVEALDHFLSTSGWDLWPAFGTAVERTSERLVRWWAQPFGAKAVLILDGLSLRELPWLLQGAKEHGFTIHSASASGSELPGETDEFARALGFSSRSQLQNNGAGLSHRLPKARTECVDMPWKDCAQFVDASPNWVFWHHWPDSQVHDGSGAGQGLEMLSKDAAEQLSSNDFWQFVETLAKGRRLVITSDHGYAATGLFHDAPDDQAKFLKDVFKSGRSKPGTSNAGSAIPPVALQITSPHGPCLMALGRWKWRSQGGYPTLAHGGLSLLEVLSPFVELTK
ncbi:MAG TPA: hypothetical protein VM240_13565 [Verrucomicrobiae bacterium]|nr:hypothetical protein [Verrucomicrobiae bacterium]